MSQVSLEAVPRCAAAVSPLPSKEKAPDGTRKYVARARMRGSAPAFCFVGLMGLFLCQSDSVGAQSRQWLAPLEEVGRIEDAEGALLGNPMLIQASDSGRVLLADWSDDSIKKISSTGDVSWVFGRTGEGPAEFRDRVIDLEFDGVEVVALDRSGRVTTIDNATGRHVRTEEVADDRFMQPAEQLFSRRYGDGEPVVLSPNFDFVWTSGERSLPSPDVYPALPSEITLHRTAANARDGGAVIFHTWSDQMVLIDETGGYRGVVRGIERIDFPEPIPVVHNGQTVGYRPNPQAITAVRSAAVTDDRIVVLFQGESEFRGRVIDSYDRDGGYAGSYLLPEDVRASTMTALSGGVLAFIDTSLVPMIVFFAEAGSRALSEGC